MDWSLGVGSAPHPFLRNRLGFPSYYPIYYIAAVIDVILRFNWISYLIYAHDMQHSSVCSFLVSFSEVLRRGMWVLFRVENEHCNNVSIMKVARTVKLPYDVEVKERVEAETLVPHTGQFADYTRKKSRRREEGISEETANSAEEVDVLPPPAMTPVTDATSDAPDEDLERTASARATAANAGESPAAASLRKRQTWTPSTRATGLKGQASNASIRARVGTLMRAAHAQDFERANKAKAAGSDEDSDEEDEEDDDGEEVESEEEPVANHDEQMHSREGHHTDSGRVGEGSRSDSQMQST